jgi:hypothetical protein
VVEAGEALRMQILDVHRMLDPYAHGEAAERAASIDVSGGLKEARARYYGFMRAAERALMGADSRGPRAD